MYVYKYGRLLHVLLGHVTIGHICIVPRHLLAYVCVSVRQSARWSQGCGVQKRLHVDCEPKTIYYMWIQIIAM